MLLILLSIVLYLSSWQCVEGDPGPKALAKTSDTTDLNPNGSSELSRLMREMLDHASAARKLAIENRKNSVYPVSFDNIYSAEPTDKYTKNEFFDSFADAYLKAVKNYSSSGDENIKENYNNIVNSCLACHSTHCPGPIVKIKKLLLN